MVVEVRNILRIVIIISCLFGAQASFGQSNQVEADRIYQLLASDTLTKSERIILLRRAIGNESKPQKNMLLANELLSLASGKEFAEDIHYAYMAQGNSLKLLGNHLEAIDKYFKAAEYSDQNNYKKGKGEAYTTIAGTYKQIGDFELASDYYKKATDTFIELGDSVSLGLVYFNVGYGFYEIGLYDSARYLTELGTSICANVYPNVVDYAKGNLALIDMRLGNEGGYDSLILVLDRLKTKGDDFAISDYLSQLSGILKDKGDTEKAITTAEESLELSMNLGLKEQIRDASLSLSELYKSVGDIEKAYSFQRQYMLYKDSISNIESLNKIANLRTEFEVGQAQAEVELLKAQRDVRNVFLLVLLIGLSSVLILSVVQYRNIRYRKRINQTLRFQKEELEAQKVQLETVNKTKDRFFSIISHDLRGPVNAFHGVSAMIKFFVKNKQIDQLEVLAEEIDHSVDRLSNLLDNLLNWAVQQQGQFTYVPEKINIKTMVEDLLEIFATMAKSKQISLHASVPEELDSWSDRNTTMTIVRNLVSNALKFTPKQGEVRISAHLKKGGIEIQVQDNGIGIPKQKLGHLFELNEENSTWGTEGEKGLGLGLQLVKEFVELNHGMIRVENNDDGGATFTVTLPNYDLQQVKAEI